MRAPPGRQLLVIADDFGIGPATSQGILDLASRGIVTGTVLLVNSPFAVQAVDAWRRAGKPLELGWHPCLTLDKPLSPSRQIASLVGGDGRFHSLAAFLTRLMTWRIDPEHVRRELDAQYERYCDLTGAPPALVNAHHHLQVFSPIAAVLRELLCRQSPRPYVRRVREPARLLWSVPEARLKRTLLAWQGSRPARGLDRHGFPGNTHLAGLSVEWLQRVPGAVVEVVCHPGHYDATLLGRDSPGGVVALKRRVQELELLQHPGFRQRCNAAGFTLTAPSAVRMCYEPGSAAAA